MSIFPKVFDTGNLLSNRVKEEFLNFDYPAGIVPILFAVDSIEAIQMGAYADECFNDLVDSISESRDFKHRGMLVLVSKIRNSFKYVWVIDIGFIAI